MDARSTRRTRAQASPVPASSRYSPNPPKGISADLSALLLPAMTVAFVILLFVVVKLYKKDTWGTMRYRELVQLEDDMTTVSQITCKPLQIQTTSSAPRTMTFDGSTTLSSATCPTIPLGYSNCNIVIIGKTSGATPAKIQLGGSFGILRTATAVTFTNPGNVTKIDGSSETWGVSFTNSSDRTLLYVNAEGAASTTIDWTAWVTLKTLH